MRLLVRLMLLNRVCVEGRRLTEHHRGVELRLALLVEMRLRKLLRERLRVEIVLHPLLRLHVRLLWQLLVQLLVHRLFVSVLLLLSAHVSLRLLVLRVRAHEMRAVAVQLRGGVGGGRGGGGRVHGEERGVVGRRRSDGG